MKILRLETVNRRGIYNYDGDLAALSATRECLSIIQSLHGIDSKHPNPWGDSLLLAAFNSQGRFDEWFFGFNSECQFRMWFYNDECLRKIGEVGVTLVCYEVSRRLDGNAQSCGPMSERDAEHELWRISLLEYLEFGLPENQIAAECAHQACGGIKQSEIKRFAKRKSAENKRAKNVDAPANSGVL